MSKFPEALTPKIRHDHPGWFEYWCYSDTPIESTFSRALMKVFDRLGIEFMVAPPISSASGGLAIICKVADYDRITELLTKLPVEYEQPALTIPPTTAPASFGILQTTAGGCQIIEDDPTIRTVEWVHTQPEVSTVQVNTFNAPITMDVDPERLVGWSAREVVNVMVAVEEDVVGGVVSALSEIKRAETKHGKQDDLSDLQRLAILVEEIGELAQCCNKLHVPTIDTSDGIDWQKNLRKELVQAAAMCLKWLSVVDAKEMVK